MQNTAIASIIGVCHLQNTHFVSIGRVGRILAKTLRPMMLLNVAGSK